MFLSERIAVKIGNSIKSFSAIDEDKEQIIIYGAINLLQIIFSILWICVLGLIFDVFYEALLFSITVSILRKYSGGVHASSPSRCIFMSTIVALVVGTYINNILCNLSISAVLFISIVIIVFSFIIVLKNAPVDSIKKPITDIKLRKQFKKKSIMVILIYSFIILVLFLLSKKYSWVYYIKFIECISIGMLWQTITLTKLGINVLSKVDLAIKYIIEGGDNNEKYY